MFPRGNFSGKHTTSGGLLNPIEEAILIKHIERMKHLCKEQIEYILMKYE
jgi:hypothetical protein